MLAHLSTKFTIPSVSAINEPRAALILNRFTRTLSILYATDAVATILGVPANQLSGTSFYECIQEDCLQDAINCLERAKQNDSIAYLRFWFRDPRFAGRSRSHSIDSYDAKQGMDTHMDVDGDSPDGSDESTPTSLHPTDIDLHPTEFSSLNPQGPRLPPLASSPDAAYPGPLPDGPEADDSPITAGPRQNSEESLFDRPPTLISDPSSEPSSVSAGDESHTLPAPSIELEAVISCTSDGLVVVIRKAKAVMQTTFRRPALHPYAHGLFASPWATSPLLPPPTIFNQGFNPGLASSDMMKSIEECACFAWSLGTVNGSLLDYASGRPSGEAAPLVLNVWDPINGMPGQHVPSIRPEDNERDMNGHGSPPPPPPPPTSHGSAYNPTRPEAIPPFNTEVRGPLQPLQPTVHKEIQYRHPSANRTPHNPSASQNILWSSLNGYADAAQQAAPPSQLCPDQNSNGHYAPNAARTATITHVDRAQDVEMVD